jgi:hypothetical protein
VEADTTEGDRLRVIPIRLFVLGVHSRDTSPFVRPTIVPIAVSELLATRRERPGAFLLRTCLSISVVSGMFAHSRPFPGSPL